MKAYQLTVPADNQPGKLAKVTSALSLEKINIRAITISSFGKEGFFNIIVDDPATGQKVLEREGIKAQLKEVIAVLINDKPGGLDRLVQDMADNNINVENAYGFVVESRKQAVFVIDTNDLDEALKICREKKWQTLSAEALSFIEPFHYMKY